MLINPRCNAVFPFQEPMKFSPNPQGIATLNRAIEEAWADVIAELYLEFTKVIEDPEAFAHLGFLDQDIVDTGRFRDSQTVQVIKGKATFNWAPRSPTGYVYAWALYHGFMAWGRKWVPGRPWVEEACDRVDIPKAFQAALARRGIKARIKFKQKLIK